MIFIDNKYTKYYFSIINRAKSRSTISEYTENHHIIPKSLNGNNSDDNLVRLTAREHFICHALLTKMTSGPEQYKMLCALVGMRRSRSYQNRYINSRLYSHLKSQYAIAVGERSRGKIASDESRKKMSNAGKGKKKPAGFGDKISAALKGRPKPPMTEELKRQISEKLKGRPSQRKGKVGVYTHSEEAREKIKESNRTRVISDETKAKISAANKATYEQRMATRRKNQGLV